MRPLLALSLLPGLALAQAPNGGRVDDVHQFDGISPNGEFGRSLANAGDVDGDGVDDIITGAPFADPNGLADAGSVTVHSGANGNLIHQFHGVVAGSLLGHYVDGAGDVNGDGFAEVIVGAPGAPANGLAFSGTVIVYSGADGSVLDQFDGAAAGDQCGLSVAGVEDADGDGVPDYLLASPGADPNGVSGAGLVDLRSGATGAILQTWSGVEVNEFYGWDVAGVGDIDGDGLGDVLIGSDKLSPFGRAQAGSIFLFRGVDGVMIHCWDGAAAGDRFGRFVEAAGDIDGDGVRDIIAGAPGATINGQSGAGYFRVMSGASLTVIFQSLGSEQNEHLGRSVTGDFDADGDGYADFAAGAYRATANGYPDAGYVALHSGRTGVMLARFDGAHPDARMGRTCAALGSLDGNAFDELAVGASSYDAGGVNGAGAVFVHQFHPQVEPSGTTISQSAGGTLVLRCDFPHFMGGDPYRLLMSAVGAGPTLLGQLPVPLTQDSWTVRTWLENYPGFFVAPSGNLDAFGDVRIEVPAAPGAIPGSLVGSTFYFAVLAGPNTSTWTHCTIAVPSEIVP